jgi:hypothetical protein
LGKLSEKYVAGFLDSDGSIQVLWRAIDRADSQPEIKRPYLSLEFTQLTCNDEVLYRIQDSIGGIISTDDKKRSSCLKLFGSPAVQVLNRIKKYLVVKRHYAEVVLEILGKPQNKEVVAAYLKAQRKVKGGMPNYPSGKWLAGYFDGDGCFTCRIGKGKTGGQLVAEVTSSAYDAEGIELLQKVFGGSIASRVGSTGNVLTSWTLTMPASKAKEFVGYFADDLIVKREQAYFILGCAEMGHFRDGKRISAVLKHLKTQPHRLSEPKEDVRKLVESVENVKTDREKFRESFAQNGGCRCGGSGRLFAHGLCRKCYEAKRLSKR